MVQNHHNVSFLKRKKTLSINMYSIISLVVEKMSIVAKGNTQLEEWHNYVLKLFKKIESYVK